jgi:hypothetical protein
MSDAPTTANVIAFSRAENYEFMYSNWFKTRIGMSEYVITFSSLIDGPGAADVVGIQEKLGVAMTWTTLKMLALTLSTAVEGIERVIGPIPILPNLDTDPERAAAIVRGLGLSPSKS